MHPGAKAPLAPGQTVGHLAAMHPALRFMLATFASAFAALLAIDLVFPFADMLSSERETSLSHSLGTALALLPLVLVLGGIVALPVAAIAGGALIALENGRARPLSLAAWLSSGLAVGLAIALLLSDNTDANGRIVTAIWFSACGTLAAWAFRLVWYWRRQS